MERVTKAQIPELFKIEITPAMEKIKDWGVIITDRQIIIFRKGDEEEWESHTINIWNELKNAFPNITSKQLEEKYNNRIVIITCTPMESFIVNVPSDSNLSVNQHNSVLKFLESIKGTDLGIDMDFEGRCVVFNLGTTQYAETLDGTIEMLQGMKPQFSDTDASEVIIGIPTGEYLCDEQKNKPRT